MSLFRWGANAATQIWRMERKPNGAIVQRRSGNGEKLNNITYYSFSSVAWISVFAATIAGASTIPIKARAIIKSCIEFTSSEALPLHSAYNQMIVNIRRILNSTNYLQTEMFVLVTDHPNGVVRARTINLNEV